MAFEVMGRGSVQLRLPGAHNVLNAMAALIAADHQGVPFADAVAALATFEGTGRRFEVRADVDGIAVIDDYAHHPTAIRVTLEAARGRYPDRALWAVWQPHTYSRTRALLDEYAAAFDKAEHVLVTDIFAAREQPLSGVNSAAVIAAIKRHNAALDARHTPTLTETAALLDTEVRAPAAILIMSAGDAPQIGIEFLKRRGLQR
jgi:UDP-N-acetylmuramate--alanine ligase